MGTAKIIPVVFVVLLAAGLGYFLFCPTPVDRNRVYRIGYGEDVPFHLTGPDGQPTGLAVNLVQAAAQRAGIKLEWVRSVDFDQTKMDLWVLMTVRPIRFAQMHLTEPYLQAESCYLVRADSPVRDITELAQARISYRNAVILRDSLKQLMPESRPVPAPDTIAALAKLSTGEADAAFVDQHVLTATLLTGELRTPLRMLPTRTPRRALALASSFVDAPVADEIRRAMRAMTEDRSSTELTERWTFFFDPTTAVIGELARQDSRVHQLAIGLLVLLVILAIMTGLIIWSRLQATRLRRTRKLLRDVADRVPGMVYQFQLNPDGTSCFPYASEAIRQIYRTSPESVREDASRVFAVLHPEDADTVGESIRRSAKDLTPWKHDYRVKFGDGTVRWLAGTTALPNRDRDGVVVWHGFVTDITDAKAAEAAMHAFERKIQETQKLESLGLLAGGIAHDFNNLLTGILGNTSLASYSLAADAPEHEYLESIKQGGLRAAELCKQMLAYSGKGRFVVRKVSLNSLVEDTTQLLRLSINKQAELKFDLSANLPPIEADTTQIHQVVMNLVINASEAIDGPNGTISLSTTLVEIAPARSPDAPELPASVYVCLEVTDTGCGISPENQKRIFDPFFTTKFTGRGLGLAAVHGIVRAHKGILKVRSQLGHGTTFEVYFPVAEGAPDSLPNLGAIKIPSQWRGEGCVLVVDDEDNVRRTVSSMLRRLGFSVMVAGDGREGVGKFRNNPDQFVVVLLDLTMPQLDGKRTLAELQKIRSDVRVILMSGFNEEEAAPDFAGKNLAGFLQKPFEFDAFIAVLRRATAEE